MESEASRNKKAIGGFVTWILTGLAMLLYLVWSVLDESTLQWIGMRYYPDKYWAVAIPAWVAMTFYFYLSTYFLTYMVNTDSLDSMYCLTDTKAKGGKASLGSLVDNPTQASIPTITDIPASVSSHVLHLAWQE